MFDLCMRWLKRRVLAALFIAWALAVAIAGIQLARADEAVVDVLILTGIDVSGSMSTEDVMVEIEGIAMAIQSPDVMAAIQSGPTKRIGFAVFLWASEPLQMVAPWRVIASEDDAAAAAADLVAGAAAAVPDWTKRAGWMTDLTGALESASVYLDAAPLRSSRAVLNVVTDGSPTERVDAVPAVRQQLMSRGVTINGMIVGGSADDVAYFRSTVIGGKGTFLTTASKAESLVAAFRSKFRLDLAMVTP